MKLRNILSVLAAGMLTLTACEDEKDLVIYEGDLPIKTSTLYMVGDATPNGWSIDSPTPLTATEEDPLVFTWEGSLNAGEMKLCLTKGSWDVAFIRPEINGTATDKNGTTDQKFAMHAGDPDDKWVVADAGVYSLTFDLRNWKYSATYVSGPEAPEIEPIEAENLYLVGDASPLNAWNIDNPTPVEKKSQYEFVFEGKLYAGELKACIVTGDWDAPFIRPARADVKINKDGIEENNFVFTAAPDNKWKVEIPGIYRMTFDLKNWTVDVQYVGEFKPASKLYMIGEATEGGWDLGKATEITAEASNDNIFVWEGELGRGTFKAARERSFDAPFYRPATSGITVSDKGVSSHEMVFTTDPDDQWEVTVAGKYRLTFDTEAMTFDAMFLSGDVKPAPLYMIGSATPGGWSLDNATEMTPVDGKEGVYTWEGKLVNGEMKACFTRDFGAEFYRPSKEGVTISKNGVSASDMIFRAGDPDYKWNVTDEGTYVVTLDTKNMTITTNFKE